MNWKTISLEPLYEVSEDGKIRNKKTKHIKSLRNDRYGYLRVTLYPIGKTYTVHRLVAIAFVPNFEEKETVNHKNGNKHDNRVINLEWCSSRENTHHAIETGLRVNRDISGEKNPASVFSEEEVVRIKYGDLSEMKTSNIAKFLNKSYESVRRIKTGQHWSNI